MLLLLLLLLHTMLHADKAALEQKLRVEMLQLQWRELEYLHTNFQNLATSSAVLVGFGFAAFGITNNFRPEDKTEHHSIWELGAYHWTSWIFITEIIFQTLFLTTSVFGLAFNLVSLFISTTSIMCGPGMALRGPEGSVASAVRHLELQLKRALRFFGRGVVAFTFSIMTIGIRRLHSIAFLGGVMGIFISMWTLAMLWYYGADIAEKFHVSSERAVRGEFVTGADGQSHWQNTSDERLKSRVVSGWFIFGIEIGRRTRRWRPQGHTMTTPLWRLDKMIAFPYIDDERLRRFYTHGDKETVAARERAMVQNLVMNAQGPREGAAATGAPSGKQPSSRSALGDSRSSTPDSFDDSFAPASLMKAVLENVMGGGVEMSGGKQDHGSSRGTSRGSPGGTGSSQQVRFNG